MQKSICYAYLMLACQAAFGAEGEHMNLECRSGWLQTPYYEIIGLTPGAAQQFDWGDRIRRVDWQRRYALVRDYSKSEPERLLSTLRIQRKDLTFTYTDRRAGRPLSLSGRCTPLATQLDD